MLLVLFSLAQLVQGASTNTTSASCPPPDGTTRSVWSILGSCALTLLICVWHAIHFDVPQSGFDGSFAWRGLCALGSFFAPEVVVAIAATQWHAAHCKVLQFREKGYEWSMTHSFFAEMGGFVYRDDKGDLRTIKSLEFLELCVANKIANPAITLKEIKATSKSDALGKAILVVQLFWFMLQVVVRGSSGFAVTLVELDTVCMAVLSLLLLLLWWDKPLRPECPHIFYSPQEVKVNPPMGSPLANAWKSEPSHLGTLMAYFTCTRKAQSITDDEATTLVGTDELKPIRSKRTRLVDVSEDSVQIVSLYVTWMLLGALHLIAWNFEFPTETEKIIWRVASFVLAGSPVAILAIGGVLTLDGDDIAFSVLTLGVISRMLLVALMLASLRALPPSAHQTVSWIAYIPHL